MTKDRFREGQLVQIVSPVEEVYDLNGELASTMTSNRVLAFKQIDPPRGQIHSLHIQCSLDAGMVVLYLGKADSHGRLKILTGEQVYELDPECLEEVSQNGYKRRNSCLS